MGGKRSPTGTIPRPSVVAAAVAVHDAVSTQELLAAGLSRKQIHHLAQIGFLHPWHRGVWAVGRPRLSFDGRCRAAILACGPGSAVGHISAARQHGLRSSSGRIHVCAPRSREAPGHPELWVHRPRSLPADEVVERDGLRFTSVGRTLLDMAPGQPLDRVAKWIHEAGVQRVLDAREIWSVIARHPHHRGRRVLEAALAAEVAPTRSGLEEALLSICRLARVPPAIVNEHVWTGERLEEVDFHWPELSLVVECDSSRYHWSRWRRRLDAEKSRRLRRVGWVVWRVHELEIELEPAAVAAELRRLATVGRAMVPPGEQRPPTAYAGGA